MSYEFITKILNANYCPISEIANKYETVESLKDAMKFAHTSNHDFGRDWYELVEERYIAVVMIGSGK